MQGAGLQGAGLQGAGLHGAGLQGAGLLCAGLQDVELTLVTPVAYRQWTYAWLFKLII